MRNAVSYPVASRTRYTDFNTKEALKALISPKPVEFIKCMGCLESNPNLSVCSKCFQRMLKRKVCFR